MLSPQANIKILAQRARPSYNADNTNNDISARGGSYGEQYMLSMIRKSHLLADEGSYFTANNAQTTLSTNNGTAFSATAPFFLVQNGNSVASGLRCYLDQAVLVTTVAGSAASAASSINVAVSIDSTLRYSSGGTSLTPVSPNMDGTFTSNVSVYAGVVTATAASGAVRNVVGQRILRPTVSATVLGVIGEQFLLNFGNVEGGQGSFTLANANLINHSLPPVIIGPGSSALIYIWTTSTTPVTPQYIPELSFWVR